MLWRRYALALLIVLVLIVGGYIFQKGVLLTAGHDADLVADSSQQKARITQILLHGSEFFRTADPAARDRMEAYLDDLSALNDRIRNHVADEPHLTALYSSADGKGLGQQIDEFVGLGHVFLTDGWRASDALAKMSLLYDTTLRADIAEAIKAFEAHAENHVVFATMAQDVTLTLAVLILLTEVFVIFVPAQRLVSQTVGQFERRTADLNAKAAQLQEYADNILHTARHDELTGLPKREQFRAVLEAKLADPAVPNDRIAVIHADLDQFKPINDTLGHSAGDKVLLRVGQILRTEFDGHGLAARIGGDEFVALTVVDDDVADPQEEIQALCDRLIATLSAPMVLDGAPVRVGASIGYTFAEEGQNDAEGLVANADLALYEAKDAGRGVARPYHPRLRQSLEKRLSLIGQITAAVEDGQFIPHFEPRLDAERGALAGIEVQPWWRHPRRGLLRPDAFILDAEDVGLLQDVEARIILDAIEGFADLTRAGYTLRELAFSVSCASLALPDFADRLTRATDRHGIDPKQIAVILNPFTLNRACGRDAECTIVGLVRRGFSLQLNAFGSDGAPLAKMADLGISGVKVDPNLFGDRSDAQMNALMTSLSGIARALDMKIHASGLKSAAQMDLMTRQKVNTVQGPHILSAKSLEAMAEWLALRTPQAGFRRTSWAPPRRRATSLSFREAPSEYGQG